MNKLVQLLIVICCIAIVIIFYFSSKDSCFLDFECQWKITNCCSETAGAQWECVNVKSFNETNCPKVIFCPQILSPKPNLSCMCEKGKCVVK